MNSTFFIIGCCNIAIGCSSLRKNGNKRNIIAYLNLLLGIFLIISSFTIFKHAA
ncbi:hypothetical protein [uncultured Muribaculum sp.]|uniref:hypothetical protein n=1 Tax=uncultured Muribaculum sp. TaxID=1918613 RepID=UPI00264A3C55|nr:hypothetical protein [uncultured Muribaculum sp.]